MIEFQQVEPNVWTAVAPSGHIVEIMRQHIQHIGRVYVLIISVDDEFGCSGEVLCRTMRTRQHAEHRARQWLAENA